MAVTSNGAPELLPAAFEAATKCKGYHRALSCLEGIGMANDIPSILHHVSVGTDDLERASAFYDAVMPHLGASRLMSFPFVVAYGKQFPEFWIGKPLDQGNATAGNGAHVCFIAPSREAVDAFHAAGLAGGRGGRWRSGSETRLRPGILRSLPARPRRSQGRGRDRSGRLPDAFVQAQFRHADRMAWNWAPSARRRPDVGKLPSRGRPAAFGSHVGLYSRRGRL